MKRFRIYSSLLFLTLIWGCNDNFLERIPLDSLNSETYWTSVNSLKVYNNQLYSDAGNSYKYQFLLGHTNSTWYSSYMGMFWEDNKSDNLAPNNGSLNVYEQIATGTNTIPATPTSGGWYWDFLRTCNVFMENFEKVNGIETNINHYVGETRLFRAWFYWDKVKHFGNVPLIKNSLNIDSPELYAERTDRNSVMDFVLEDLNFACENLPNSWDSDNPDRLNRWAALTIKSRICLYEGTYRKYHNKGEYQSWLKAAANAAEEVIDNGPYTLVNDYSSIFNSTDLSNNKEVIFFRKYIAGVLVHSLNNYILQRTTGMTKDCVEDYLCNDGKPIQLSNVYLGDENIESELRNRDPRLTMTILHPDDAQDILRSAWAAYDYPRVNGQTGGYKSTTGYTLIKFHNRSATLGFGKDDSDAPIVRLGEAMVNFAEAKVEMGIITQEDLDKSINALRDRVNMPHLSLNPPMDPKYANEGLSSLLVEVRRERRVELAIEGFRFDDIVRWKKGEYLNKRVLGMRWEAAQIAKHQGANVKSIEINGKNYIDVYKGSVFENRQFSDKNYLFPLPLNSISQNPNLGQNPGW